MKMVVGVKRANHIGTHLSVLLGRVLLLKRHGQYWGFYVLRKGTPVQDSPKFFTSDTIYTEATFRFWH